MNNMGQDTSFSWFKSECLVSQHVNEQRNITVTTAQRTPGVRHPERCWLVPAELELL